VSPGAFWTISRTSSARAAGLTSCTTTGCLDIRKENVRKEL
jgi:hypothetical protein